MSTTMSYASVVKAKIPARPPSAKAKTPACPSVITPTATVVQNQVHIDMYGQKWIYSNDDVTDPIGDKISTQVLTDYYNLAWAYHTRKLYKLGGCIFTFYKKHEKTVKMLKEGKHVVYSTFVYLKQIDPKHTMVNSQGIPIVKIVAKLNPQLIIDEWDAFLEQNGSKEKCPTEW